MWSKNIEARPTEEDRVGRKLEDGNVSKNFVTELPNNGIGSEQTLK